jgi:hypothetical protein
MLASIGLGSLALLAFVLAFVQLAQQPPQRFASPAPESDNNQTVSINRPDSPDFGLRDYHRHGPGSWLTRSHHGGPIPITVVEPYQLLGHRRASNLAFNRERRASQQTLHVLLCRWQI